MTIFVLRQFLTAAMVLNGVALFSLQVWAWHRNKHSSFGLLAVSTLFAAPLRYQTANTRNRRFCVRS
jgi:hypothetical protein